MTRDVELLLSNTAATICAGNYFACGMFYMFRLIIVSYCQLCRRLQLLAFVNIASDNFMLSFVSSKQRMQHYSKVVGLHSAVHCQLSAAHFCSICVH